MLKTWVQIPPRVLLKRENKVLLFGYGTIRSDLGNYSAPPVGGKSIGFGRTKGELWKIRNSFGVWAGVKESPETSQSVFGEVFEVSDQEWPKLDRREQVNANPPCYLRKQIEATMQSGRIVLAFIYFTGPGQTEWIKNIVSGDWRDELQEKTK